MLEVGSELEVGQVSLCGTATNQTGTFPAPSPNLHLGKNTPQVHEEAHFESVDLLNLKQGKNLAQRHDTPWTELTPAVVNSLTSRVTAFSRNTTPRRCKRQGISVSWIKFCSEKVIVGPACKLV